VRLSPCVIGGIVLASCTQLALLAQEKATPASPQRTAVSVPFVGCASDGQTGPQEAPSGTTISVSISLEAADQLAYYTSGQEVGVLAPRGWYCFGTYGSGGDTLFVSPQSINTASLFSAERRGFSGPAIEISYSSGGTSGRFEVAEVIARVFPAYKPFVTRIVEEFGQPASSFPFGPYPKDILTYKGKTVVEYKTPAQTEGLGTHSSLKKNDSPIYGAAILIGQTPDLLLLSVRLPPDLAGLTSAIVRQVESDAARLPN
jgi:hypothetical protein